MVFNISDSASQMKKTGSVLWKAETAETKGSRQPWTLSLLSGCMGDPRATT